MADGDDPSPSGPGIVGARPGVVNSAAAAIIRAAVDAPRPRILYIAGAGRSGSTLLAMLLGGLPGCTAVGELRHIWERGVLGNRLCGCGEPFHDCPFWSQVGQTAFGGWDGVDAERQAARLMRVGRQRHFPLVAAGAGSARFRAELEAYAGLQARVYRAVAAVSGDAAIVDSSKSPVYALTLRTAGLDVDVIHLVRDSRAVAYSWTRSRAMQDTAAPEYMPTFGPAWSSLTWMSNNLAVDAVRGRGLRPRVVRYERLVAGPARELVGALGDGLPAAARSALRAGGDAGEFSVGVQHTVAGNPVRMQSGPLRLRVDDAWRTSMPAGDRRLVTLLTFPLLARYGYARREDD